MSDTKINNDVELRKKAESLLLKKSSINHLNEADSVRLIHELQVHQIELEMQSEIILERDERFRKLLTNVPGAVYQCDCDKARTVRYMGCRVQDLTGYPPSDFIDNAERSIGSILHPEDLASVEETISNAIQRGETWDVEYRVCCSDGAILWVQDKGRADVSSDGVEKTCYGFLQDISMRKMSDAREKGLTVQLLRAAKMETIGQLTSGIAHDFNNILAIIIGNVDLAKILILKSGKNNSILKYLEQMHKAGIRAKELISQMMQFVHGGDLTADSDEKIVSVDSAMHEVMALLKTTLPSTIRISMQSHVSDNTYAKIHPVKLHQILLNLGLNARDSIEEYGIINFEIKQSVIANSQCASCNQKFSGKYIEIAVSDNGCGINRNNLYDIFTPFYSTKGVERGGGMGLSVVHGIIHSVAGHLLVESDLKKGSLFRVFLPVVDAVQTPDHPVTPTEEKKKSLTGLSVMVVDDEIPLTTLIKEYLEINGAEVLTFNSSVDALDSITKEMNGVDLLVTDETMPGLTGSDMAKKIHQICPELPIILCTGRIDMGQEKRDSTSGISKTMYKPLDLNLLVNSIAGLTRIEK
jgi:PAS domain S-box-containing protein